MNNTSQHSHQGNYYKYHRNMDNKMESEYICKNNSCSRNNRRSSIRSASSIGINQSSHLRKSKASTHIHNSGRKSWYSKYTDSLRMCLCKCPYWGMLNSNRSDQLFDNKNQKSLASNGILIHLPNLKNMFHHLGKDWWNLL